MMKNYIRLLAWALLPLPGATLFLPGRLAPVMISKAPVDFHELGVASWVNSIPLPAKSVCVIRDEEVDWSKMGFISARFAVPTKVRARRYKLGVRKVLKGGPLVNRPNFPDLSSEVAKIFNNGASKTNAPAPTCYDRRLRTVNMRRKP